jgi:hypothetical protein
MSENVHSSRRRTPRERFLDEMDGLVPWSRLLALISPHYPAAGPALQLPGPERMLRVHFLAQWFNLTDTEIEAALYDSESMRRFVGIAPGEDSIPGATAIVAFRHLLQQHALATALFAETQRVLEEEGLMIKAGTIVDPAMVPASGPSAYELRNRGRERRRASQTPPNGAGSLTAATRQPAATSR